MNADGTRGRLQQSCEPTVICTITKYGLVVPGLDGRDEGNLVMANMAW